jgi:Sodium/hydrogen exchanger family
MGEKIFEWFMMKFDRAEKTNNLVNIFVYVLMVIGVGGAYLAIRWYGEGLSSVSAVQTMKSAGGSASSSADTMLHVLLALVVVIVMARTLGALFRKIHQPPVIGEIIAGIVLGPSVLGRIAPGVASYVLPPSVAPFLNIIAQIGVILYMFLVGLELDPKLLRNRGHATVAISHASILAPFLMGAGLALILFPTLSPGNVSFTSFSLFIAVSMSITAFPVLARILTDRGIHKTRMGAIALTCAAVDDVTAWCLLALVVSVVEARTSGALSTIVMALAFIAAMILVGRPAMVRLTFLYGNRGLTQGLMAGIFVALLILRDDDRPDRNSCDFRGLRTGRDRSARQQSGAGTYRSPGRSGDRSAAAGILRLYWFAHADRPGQRARSMADLRTDNCSRIVGEIRRRDDRCPLDRT